MRRHWKGGKDEKILKGSERGEDIGRKGKMRRFWNGRKNEKILKGRER